MLLAAGGAVHPCSHCHCSCCALHTEVSLDTGEQEIDLLQVLTKLLPAEADAWVVCVVAIRRRELLLQLLMLCYEHLETAAKVDKWQSCYAEKSSPDFCSLVCSTLCT